MLKLLINGTLEIPVIDDILLTVIFREKSFFIKQRTDAQKIRTKFFNYPDSDLIILNKISTHHVTGFAL